MVAPVDEKTGIVSQLAIDKQKNVYEKHPQTGETISIPEREVPHFKLGKKLKDCLK